MAPGSRSPGAATSTPWQVAAVRFRGHGGLAPRRPSPRPSAAPPAPGGQGRACAACAHAPPGQRRQPGGDTKAEQKPGCGGSRSWCGRPAWLRWPRSYRQTLRACTQSSRLISMNAITAPRPPRPPLEASEGRGRTTSLCSQAAAAFSPVEAKTDAALGEGC